MTFNWPGLVSSSSHWSCTRFDFYIFLFSHGMFFFFEVSSQKELLVCFCHGSSKNEMLLFFKGFISQKVPKAKLDRQTHFYDTKLWMQERIVKGLLILSLQINVKAGQKTEMTHPSCIWGFILFLKRLSHLPLSENCTDCLVLNKIQIK